MWVSMLILVVAIPALGLLGFALHRAGKAYWRLHGPAVVACPETGEPAAVRLSEWRAVRTAVFGRPRLRLRDCSRWPGRGRCGQPCLVHIEAAPQDCLIRQVLSEWYRGKSCICCGRPFAEIGWGQHKPCLMSPEQRIFEWQDIRPEKIPRTLETHRPVCRTCFVAEAHTW